MKRNYGIDLLRMVLMFMVVVLHVLGHGGVLDTAVPLSMNYALAWLLECFAYCAVNCYALITGYVYYNSKYRLSSLIQIWLQVWLYSFGISVAMWILKPEYFSMEGLIRAALPVTYKMYWYFSAYVGLFMLIPILNAAIEHMSERKTKNVLLLSALFISVIPVFSGEDPFGDKGGYSTFWLAYLYLIGASIRKYEWEKVLKNTANIYIYIYIYSAYVFPGCVNWRWIMPGQCCRREFRLNSIWCPILRLQ